MEYFRDSAFDGYVGFLNHTHSAILLSGKQIDTPTVLGIVGFL